MDQRETAWRREAHDRYDNYAMLARLFQREVDAELLADLKESFAAEPTGDHRFDEGCALLRQHLDGVDDVARGRSALAIDYCLTFLGYGTDPDAADEAGLRAAYPYESIYRSGGKTLGGDRCAQVSQAYRAGEFAPDTERIIAQDHLACELSFMRHLVGREMAAWDRKDAEGARALRAQQAEAEPLPGMEYMLALSGVNRLEDLDAFREGLIQVQDASSALVGEIAAPRPGDYVIDVCAAPGGKSLHLADRLNGTGTVEARDLTPQKIGMIEENIARCRMPGVRAVLQDALAYDPDSREKADIVLADLPCSGLGIMGRKPDIKYHMTPEKMRELAALQREILSVVWQYVKPGGFLLYSTCTIDRLENEENVRWFAENFPFEPVDLSNRLPAGVTGGVSRQKGCLQLLPGAGPFDGFFISLLKRQE